MFDHKQLLTFGINYGDTVGITVNILWRKFKGKAKKEFLPRGMGDTLKKGPPILCSK